MASARNFTTLQAVNFCLDNDGDSSIGGLTTDEEEEIDRELLDQDSYASCER